jgi:hypothetical protein
MVNEEGQLYTIEAISAGILMLVTAYLVLSTTSLYTPGDSHINDMQLEQIGNDALAMMDTPETYGGTGNLSLHMNSITESSVSAAPLYAELHSSLAKTSGTTTDNLKVNGTIYWRDPTSDTVMSRNLVGGDIYHRESTVTVHRWVFTNNTIFGSNPTKTVLLEVRLWRV